MGLCDSIIKKNITVDCASLITKGLETNGVIINRQDVDFSATEFDAIRKNIVKTLALKTGKKRF